MDGVFQFKLAPGGNSIIRDVESGNHSLEARSDDKIIAERVVNVNEDIEWTVYTQTYDITVINETGFRFAFHLDGVFQFHLEPRDMGTITDVLEGIHTLDARIDDDIIAEETISVDRDIEWTVF
jgi:hypothetical protein